MKIVILVNNRKKEAMQMAKTAEQYLQMKGAAVSLLADENYSLENFVSADCIITVGGDGTVLRLAGVLNGLEVPLLGINAGNLGYLTEVAGFDAIPEALDRLLSGDYLCDVRSMLHGSVRRNGEVIARGTALNEILITRSSGISVLRFTVFCEGKKLATYVSDGIIFCTPTGSTAYNLSAGGPVVSPDTPVIIMNPVCPHALYARTVVLPDSCQLEVKVESENQRIAFDGERIQELEPGDIITVRKAIEKTVLVKLSKESFLETLRAKFDQEQTG